MDAIIEYRYMTEGEASKVSALILDVFNEFVALEYSFMSFLITLSRVNFLTVREKIIFVLLRLSRINLSA